MTKESYFAREIRLHTHEQMMEKLAQRTRAQVEPEHNGSGKLDPEGNARSDLGLADTGQSGFDPRPQPLIWGRPVKHGDQTGFQIESTGRFSIVREKDSARGPEAVIYRLFDRTLGKMLSSHPTAQEAREAAEELVK